MPGAQFQMLIGSGAPAATATYQGIVNGDLSGTFVIPPGGGLIVICLAWLFSTAGSPSESVVIAGRAASLVKSQSNGGASGTKVAIYAMMVGPGDPNSFSTSGASIVGANASAFVYQVVGVRGLNATATSSSASSPSTTINIPASSAVIACGKAQSSTVVDPSWTGITEDQEIGDSNARTSAHDNYLTADPGHSITCNLPGSTRSAACFAVFSP